VFELLAVFEKLCCEALLSPDGFFSLVAQLFMLPAQFLVEAAVPGILLLLACI